MLAVALLLPIGVITRGFVDIQQHQVAFSTRERDGVAYLRPTVRFSRFLADLDGALRDSGLAPQRLVVEITETAFIGDADAVTKTLHEIRARGIQLALDDFGTGYSSMSYVPNEDLATTTLGLARHVTVA